MKIAYDYLLRDGTHDAVGFTEEKEFHEFIHKHKKDFETITATLDDGRRFTYNRKEGWLEFLSPI